MSSSEQQFSIQPHPATTNDPSSDPALNNGSAADAGKPGPVIMQDNHKLGEPVDRDELAKRSAELNKD